MLRPVLESSRELLRSVGRLIALVGFCRTLGGEDAQKAKALAEQAAHEIDGCTHGTLDLCDWIQQAL